MKRLVSLIVPLLAATPCLAQWKYPETKTVDAEDVYFGKTYGPGRTVERGIPNESG